jgi:hypothetical protein
MIFHGICPVHFLMTWLNNFFCLARGTRGHKKVGTIHKKFPDGHITAYNPWLAMAVLARLSATSLHLVIHWS